MSRPTPLRADDPPTRLSAEDLDEVAKNWRGRDEDLERADTVAQALESVAEMRRLAEAGAAGSARNRARLIGQRISEFMRL